jgi:hypothetical protein
VGQAVLRKEANPQSRRLDDGPRIRLVQAGEHPEQGGLSGAIGADQPDAFAVGDLPGDLVEEDLFAEALRQGRELDHE